MATAQHILNRAFSKAGIKTSEIAITADEAAGGLDILNDILSQWSVKGPLYGVNTVQSLGDVVDIPREADAALKASIAIRLCHEYERPVHPSLAADLTEAMETIRVLNINTKLVARSRTLPRGTGNNRKSSRIRRAFYSDQTKPNF